MQSSTVSRNSLGLVNERFYVQSALPSTLKKGPKRLNSWFLGSKNPKGFWPSTTPAAGITPVLQQLSSTQQFVCGSRKQEKSPALGGKHGYPPALVWSALKLGTPNWGSHKSPDKALACKTTNPRARLPQCLSFQPEWFRHIKLIKICLERKGLSVFSITQQSLREWYSARPCCNLQQDWSASADGVWCVCYPTLHNPGSEEKEMLGF